MSGRIGVDDRAARTYTRLTAPPSLPASITGIDGQLGVFTRADGGRQLTLDGHQLYTFVDDVTAGQANGAGKKLGDSLWGVMLADGEARF
ncbi:hypothetical protein M1247_13785 [Mycobacterium sp. 21AC1]|uniref:hypothetical protein n=1 Tax=[Mycobacterium] appelbergii TaxID=2939269 RepID=UPI0029390183|nr:hypothetical protein [Mycobacterium sp. 21AC1]MDV3125994.1 hypothetical protein [Mycobacterium sp. 21AC1]